LGQDDTQEVKVPPAGVGKMSPRRDQAYLVVLAGNAMGEMFKLDRKRTVIGRGPSADVCMLDDGVSREHCEIVIEGDQVVLRDLESTNGTYCRGSRIQRHLLGDGDKILVGTGTVLKFTYHDKLDEDFQRQMHEAALRDDLTKAFNKKYFLDRVESEFAYAARHAVPLALVSFEVDNFKHINDEHGHPTGDFVLAELSSTIQATVRVEDVFARVGGEHFAVICRGADLLQGKIVADRLRNAALRRPFNHDGKMISVTISLGVATVPNASIGDAMELIAAADQALHEAKRAGGNQVSLWGT
jgi:diguanylate cyclase (GGDEF)-like protein